MALAPVPSDYQRTQMNGQPPTKRIKTGDGREIRVLEQNSPIFCFPPEMFTNGILSYFKAKDLLNFERVCRQFYVLAGDAPMWKELFSRACLPKRDSISFQNQFLSELDRRNPHSQVTMSEAEFFLNGKYIEIDLDRVIQCYNRVIMNSQIPKEEKVEVIFKKAKMIGRTFVEYPFNDDCGAIGSINSQLDGVCRWNLSKEQVARAELYISILKINSLIGSNLDLTDNETWRDEEAQLLELVKGDNAAREDQARARLFLGIMEERTPNAGETPLTYFEPVRVNPQAFPEDRAEAVFRIARLKVRNNIKNISDSEAFQYLENVRRDSQANLKSRLGAGYAQAFMISKGRGPSGKNIEDAYRMLDQLCALDGWGKRAYIDITDRAKFLKVEMKIDKKTDLMTDREAHKILRGMLEEGTRYEDHVRNLMRRLPSLNQ
ncbi:MAG: F-box-like domain-containing protein [Rhabdochlamydiaceae bacterium]